MRVDELIEAYKQELSIHIIPDLAALTIEFIISEDAEDVDLTMHGTIDIVSEIENMSSALQGAIASNNRELIDYIQDIYYRKSDVMNGACIGNRVDIINNLLDNGYDQEECFIAAARASNVHIMKEIVKRYPNIGMEVDRIYTYKDVNVIKYMRSIGMRCRIEVANMVFTQNETEIIKFLIDEKCNHVDPIKCFIEAYEGKNEELQDFLIDRFPELKDDIVLMSRCGYGRFITQYMINHASDEDLISCVTHAYVNNDQNLIKRLPKHIKYPGALSRACYYRDLELVTDLLNEGYEVTIDVLHQVAASGFSELAKRMLQINCKPVIVIMGAVEENHFDLAKEIWDLYPNTEFKNERCYETKFNDQDVEIFTRLVNAGVDMTSCISYSIYMNQQKIIRAYKGGRFLVQKYNREAFDLIFDLGADPTLTTNNMILCLLPHMFNKEAINHVIARGTNLNIMLSESSSTFISNYLIKKGANVYSIARSRPGDVKKLKLSTHERNVIRLMHFPSQNDIYSITGMWIETYSKFRRGVQKGDISGCIPRGVNIDYLLALSAETSHEVMQQLIDLGANYKILESTLLGTEFLLKKNLTSPEYVSHQRHRYRC